MDYPIRNYPAEIPDKLPRGKVLVHNDVTKGITPSQKQATRGFRFWIDDPSERLEECGCGWAPHLPEHYRVKRTKPPPRRRKQKL
jgi:hypothetical protein